MAVHRAAHFTLWEAASSPKTQAFLLVGTLFLLPVILVYTGWSYWVFRGKVRADIGYITEAMIRFARGSAASWGETTGFGIHPGIRKSKRPSWLGCVGLVTNRSISGFKPPTWPGSHLRPPYACWHTTSNSASTSTKRRLMWIALGVYITLGRLDAALASYEAALERENLGVYPKLQTRAYLDFPLLIVMRRLSELYSRAMEILDATQSRLMFPIDRYLAHGIRALILDEWGKREEAKNNAALALAAASETQSGFRYHQGAGLVPTTNDDLAGRLEAIAQTRH